MKRLALLLTLGACTEQITAPGACPDYCPGGSISVVDTIFNVIERDSTFSGYLNASEGGALPVADLPGVDSRAMFRLNGIPDSVRNRAGDTTKVPITLDSARLRVEIVHRDTGTTNLWFKLYRLPIGIDTTTTFADLLPAFTDSILDSVNVSALLASPPITDTATVRIWGDTIRTDSAGHVLLVGADSISLILFIDLDSAQARYVVADTGKVAYGVRVAADTLASIRLGANEGGRGAAITWFFSYPDTLAVPKDTSANRGALFDSFVFDPPTPATDSTLAVGGVPAARSLLRVAIPPELRDSADVVRATLILVPVGPVAGARADSFSVQAKAVIADLGGKSPLTTTTAGLETVRLNSSDTIRIEMTSLIRNWAVDTSATTAFMLLQLPEAASYTQIRFYSTRAPAFRPALHVTYVRRYAFGTP